jgi:Lamin Tail Domain/PEP-CTERM motif
MSTARTKSLSLVIAGVLMAAAGSASAGIVISEVDPFGSNGSDGYSADWFELTNTGPSAVSIAGWSMVDNHAASNTTTPYVAGATISIGSLSGGNKTFGPALLTLANGQTSIGAGQSVVFLEGSASATSAASSTTISNFEDSWFGSNVPAGLSFGVYNDGGNYGLSQSADMVNIFSGSSATSSLVASVAFGADTGTPVATFANAAGLNNTTLTQSSVVGVNGAFLSANGQEIGSPGTIGAVPLPGTAILMLSGLGLLGVGAGRKKLKAPMALA